MKPIFCGNFEYDARQSDLERLFRRYGKVDRVDMKSGFAFVYMEDERDAKDAIRALDHTEFGRNGRRLRVEWTKQERSSRQPEGSTKSPSKTRPSKTLFVINFDPYHTRTKDLERHFDPYGKILNIRIRRNFAFIQFDSQEDAAKALDATNMSKLLDRIITVEFAIKDDDDERRNGNSPDRVHNRSPRRGHDRVRSQSPYRRERDSPDYGQGGRGRSPSPHRRARASPGYVRRYRGSPDRKERGRPDRKERDHRLSPSPKKERDTDRNHKHSSSPQTKWSDEDTRNGLNPVKRASPDYSHRSPSQSPQKEEGETTYSENDAHTRSPAHSDAESPPPDRYGSRSPLARQRSQS